MKKHLLACGLVVAASAPLFAQTGSTVREDRIWNYSIEYVNIDGDVLSTYNNDGYHFNGDTIADGKKYLMFRNSGDITVALIREEDGKVYMHVNGENEALYWDEATSSSPKEVMLYDFGASVGNSYTIPAFEYDIDEVMTICPVTVTDTYLIDIAGQEMRAQTLNINGYELTAIEGIGLEDGLLHRPQPAWLNTGISNTMGRLRELSDTDGNVLFTSNDFPYFGIMIREDWKWNYTVTEYKDGEPCNEYEDNGYHFKGYEALDGVIYRRFLNGSGETVALMREAPGMVYLRLDRDAEYETEAGLPYEEPEACLYNYRTIEGKSYAGIDFYDNFSDAVIREITINDNFYIQSEGTYFMVQHLAIGGNEFYCTSGAGPDSGYLHRPHWTSNRDLLDFVEVTLRDVEDSKGNIVFRGSDLNHHVNEVDIINEQRASITYSAGVVRAADGAEVAVYDMAGKRVAQGRGSLSTASLQPGVYIVKAAANALKITVK